VESLARALRNVRTVIHCAGLAHKFGRSQPLPSDFFEVNERGTANLMRAASASGVAHVVLISSVSVYGPGHEQPNELSPCRPQGTYAESKLEGERRAIEIARQAGMRLTILRISALYGEGDPGNLARLMRAIERGRFMWVGRGENLKSLMHLEDAARACLLAAQREHGDQVEIYNLAPEPFPMRKVVTALAEELGRPAPQWHVPAALARTLARAAGWAPFFGRRSKHWYATLDKWLRNDAFDGSRFCREFDFQPSVGLRDGLRREVQWYRGTCQAYPRRKAA
jgi:nucleoside-diphosphate-sugar epimerase